MRLLNASWAQGEDGAAAACPLPALRGVYLLAEADAAPRVLIELVAIKQQRQDVDRPSTVRG